MRHLALSLLVPALMGAAAPAPVVAVLTHEGGMCRYGQCRTTTTFRADGSFSRESPKATPYTGKVDVALVNILRAQIARADFAGLKARPFTGTCPTAWDGQEDIYVFKTARGEETLRSCKYVLDPKHPLLAAARRLEEASR